MTNPQQVEVVECGAADSIVVWDTRQFWWLLSYHWVCGWHKFKLCTHCVVWKRPNFHLHNNFCTYGSFFDFLSLLHSWI